MRRIFASGLITLMAAAICTAPSWSQALQEGSTSDAAPAGEEVTASTRAKDSFGTVISAVQTAGETAGAVAAVSDASRVEVIRVRNISQGDSIEALDDAISRNRAQVERLRAAVRTNAAVSGKLEEEQVQVEDVVAAVSQEDGDLTIYAR